MANYVSLDNLRLYDQKIKVKMATEDEAILNSAKLYADGKDEAIASAKKAGDDAAAAAKVADDKAVAAQGEVDALETYVGTFVASDGVDTVVKYIDAKTNNIASNDVVEALDNRVTQAETDIDNIEKDYLKATDKTELQGKITEVQTAVNTEKSRAEGVELSLRTDINTVMGDYLKAADKTELQGNIDTVSGAVERLTNGVSAEEIDGVNDLIQYVKDHGTEVTGMQGDIAANASAIEGVAGRMTTAEGKITAVEGAVATKVEQSAYDTKVAELAGTDTALGNRIATLEGKFGDGEGSVKDMIADAVADGVADAVGQAEAKDAEVLAAAKKYADEEDAKIESRVDALETASGTHALASDLTALDGRVTTAEGKVGANETAIEGLQTAVAGKAAQTDLDAAILRIAKNETDIATLTTTVNGIGALSNADIEGLFA